MESIKILGIIFGGLLFLATLFIITNTIKLTIYSRKDEIEILKLVGATNSFVKIPFLIEGAVQGFLGGTSAIIILFIIYFTVISRLALRLGFASFSVAFLSPQIILYLITGSIMAGFIGSFISLGRFIRT